MLGWKTPSFSATSSAVMEEDDKKPGMCREQEQCHCCDRCCECESFSFIQDVGEKAVPLEGDTSQLSLFVLPQGGLDGVWEGQRIMQISTGGLGKLMLIKC